MSRIFTQALFVTVKKLEAGRFSNNRKKAKEVMINV